MANAGNAAQAGSENKGVDWGNSTADGRLTRGDVALLTVYSAVLFGIAIVSGRPLSLHEAVLIAPVGYQESPERVSR